MRVCNSLMAACVLLLGVATGAAQSPPGSGSDAADLAAIRQASRDFAAAFDGGNAAGLAEHWTDDGEYRDETGQVFTGRAAIQQEYEQFFAEHPGVKIRIHIDALRLLGDSTAIEDGRASLDPAPPGAPAVGQYTAVHVRANGGWRMASVRDTRVETPSAYGKLADLEWLIGTWTAEERGAKSEIVCRWVANKSFVERSYVVTHPDRTTTSGVQLIGFNPQGGHIQSWTFNSDGGHAVGVWTPRDSGWAVEARGMTGDGASSSAVNLLTRLDDDACTWQSVQRSLDGTPLSDTEEVVVKRQRPDR